MNKKDLRKEKEDPKYLGEAVETIYGNPETAFEMVNKYGTYEIQPTAETKNAFPTIAQGYSKSMEKPTTKTKTGNP